MHHIFKKRFTFVIILSLILSYSEYSSESQKVNDPESETIYFETETTEGTEQIITDHLLGIFPIISDNQINKILSTKSVKEIKHFNIDSLANETINSTYTVSFEVPKNFLADTAKILWKLNLPEFQSRIYQLYKGEEIYIDTWPNVVGTNKDKTYTGNFQAYRVRNWPFYKDPEPSKAHLEPTKPGPKNPLGLFVVHYDENSLRYFHGTNNPKVLNNKLRNLSHGCVRNDNDNIEKMKEFIIKRVVKSKDLSGWLGSNKTLIYNLEEIDKFPVQITYKTFEVDNDSQGKYILLFKDIYNYKNPKNIDTKVNDPSLITLSTTENIFSEYRKTFGNDINDDLLTMMVEYVINNGEEYQKYYLDDLKNKFMMNH
jgi:hypothetical protein